MKTDEKPGGAKDNNIIDAATSMEAEEIPPPCAPPDQQQQELRSEPEKEDAANQKNAFAAVARCRNNSVQPIHARVNFFEEVLRNPIPEKKQRKSAPNYNI